MTDKQRRRRRQTFTVSQSGAFVGSVVGSAQGDEIGDHNVEELEAMVRHMEGHLAEADEEGQETPGVPGPTGPFGGQDDAQVHEDADRRRVGEDQDFRW